MEKEFTLRLPHAIVELAQQHKNARTNLEMIAVSKMIDTILKESFLSQIEVEIAWEEAKKKRGFSN